MNIFGRHKNAQEEAIVQKSTEYMKKLVIACLAEKKYRGIGYALEEWKDFFTQSDMWIESRDILFGNEGLFVFMSAGHESNVYKSRYEDVVYKIRHSSNFVADIYCAATHNIFLVHPTNA